MNIETPDNDSYCYVYKRKDGTPYYIGKGRKFRFLKKGKNEVKPPKDKSRIFFACEGVSEAEAFEMEIALISLLGRKDLGTGILRNRTNGGEGSSGAVVSEEARIKMSEAKKDKPKSKKHKRKLSEVNQGEKNPMFGTTRSEETKEKISLSCSKLTKQQQLEVSQRRENGESVVDLANEFEVHWGTIYYVLKKLRKPQS